MTAPKDPLPPEGSPAHKVYQYLFGQPAGSGLSVSAIAHDIVGCRTVEVPVFMAPYLDIGLFSQRIDLCEAIYMLQGACGSSERKAPETTWQALRPQVAGKEERAARKAGVQVLPDSVKQAPVMPEAISSDAKGQAQAAEAEADSLNFALFADGEMVFYNLPGLESETQVVLSKRQTERLREYLLHTGSYCEAHDNHA